MIDDKIELTLNGQSYTARLDMGAIANAQINLKEIKKNITIPEMFNEVSDNNYSVINQMIIQSIRRCHNSLSEADILSNMKLKEKDLMLDGVYNLLKASMPIDEDNKKKVENM